MSEYNDYNAPRNVAARYLWLARETGPDRTRAGVYREAFSECLFTVSRFPGMDPAPAAYLLSRWHSSQGYGGAPFGLPRGVRPTPA